MLRKLIRIRLRSTARAIRTLCFRIALAVLWCIPERSAQRRLMCHTWPVFRIGTLQVLCVYLHVSYCCCHHISFSCRVIADCTDMSLQDSDDSYDFVFKIVLVGDVGVGKTCVVQRFKTGIFIEKQGNTIGVDFTMKTLEIQGKRVKVSAVYL